MSVEDVVRGPATVPVGRASAWPVGRVLGLALASTGIALQAVALVTAARALRAQGASGVVSVVGSSLSLVVYLLVVGAYLLRAPEAATDSSRLARAVAIAATFSPFLMPLWPAREASAAVEVLASVLLTAGLVGCAWSLRHLWRSFSVLPQARGLVSSGPYRFVRHPLYSTEILANLGMAIHFGRPFHWIVLALLVLGQVYRARREERLLCDHVPGYADYRARTACLVPGLL
jgi:protein-S-isoprenylcysteine O-methyltransferase Ste14